MKDKKQSKRYVYINKYQWPILIVTIVPSVAIICLAMLLIKLFYLSLIDMLLQHSIVDSLVFVKQRCSGIFISLLVALGLIIAFGLTVSMNLVGAFERVLRELDEVIEGKRKSGINVRKNDGLAKELLDRVNTIIGKIPKSGE